MIITIPKETSRRCPSRACKAPSSLRSRAIGRLPYQDHWTTILRVEWHLVSMRKWNPFNSAPALLKPEASNLRSSLLVSKIPSCSWSIDFLIGDRPGTWARPMTLTNEITAATCCYSQISHSRPCGNHPAQPLG